jgi:transcriptional regulator
MSKQALSRIELLQGTLDFIVLQTLRWGPRHGYGIAQMIRANSNDSLQVDTGSLYPALHRLERKKWIAADWDVSENRQRVRVYRLTGGRAQAARCRAYALGTADRGNRRCHAHTTCRGGIMTRPPKPSRDARDVDLDDEIRTHLAMAAADRIARGEAPDDAVAAARREFGNVGHVKEVTRETWGGMWFERLLQDLRYAWRSLRRSPGFACRRRSERLPSESARTRQCSPS